MIQTEDIAYYIFALVVLVVVFFLIKRVASCLIKSIVLLVVAAILAFVYFNWFKVYENGEEKPAIIQKANDAIDRQLKK